MMRLVISPSPRTITLPEDYNFSFGRGTVIHEGKDAVLFAYGPVLLNEALTAAEILAEQNFSLKVINLPWLNRIDDGWLAEGIVECKTIFALDNHSEYGGLGDHLLNALMRANDLCDRKLIKLAIDEYPACGTPSEALSYHKLDGASIADRILKGISHMQPP
jgi:transketolase